MSSGLAYIKEMYPHHANMEMKLVLARLITVSEKDAGRSRRALRWNALKAKVDNVESTKNPSSWGNWAHVEGTTCALCITLHVRGEFTVFPYDVRTVTA